MVRKAGSRAKSEALSLRLDLKNRFILEYLSRYRGQTITTVLERAIIESATQSEFHDDHSNNQVGWRSIYSPCEGARALAMAEYDELYPTYEEDKRLSFAKLHWVFFYRDRECTKYNIQHLDVIWPRIDEFLKIHDNIKEGGEYHAAAHAMRSALDSAGLDVPSWPQPDSIGSFAADMDEEIPF